MIERAVVGAGLLALGVLGALWLKRHADRPRPAVRLPAGIVRETITVMAPTRGELDAEIWLKEAADWRPFGYVVWLTDPDTCRCTGFLVQLERQRVLYG